MPLVVLTSPKLSPLLTTFLSLVAVGSGRLGSGSPELTSPALAAAIRAVLFIDQLEETALYFVHPFSLVSRSPEYRRCSTGSIEY